VLKYGEKGITWVHIYALPLKVCIKDLIAPNRLLVGGVGGVVRLAAAACSATGMPILASFFALFRVLFIRGAAIERSKGDSVSVSGSSVELMRLRGSSGGPCGA